MTAAIVDGRVSAAGDDMVLAIGIAFLSAAMFAALYFGYLDIEKKRNGGAPDERTPAPDAWRPGLFGRAIDVDASRSRKS